MKVQLSEPMHLVTLFAGPKSEVNCSLCRSIQKCFVYDICL